MLLFTDNVTYSTLHDFYTIGWRSPKASIAQPQNIFFPAFGDAKLEKVSVKWNFFIFS